MAIKKYCILFICLFCFNSIFAQEIEEQRKYLFQNNSSLLSLIDSSKQLDGLSFYSHSIYNYYDIYLDTPDFDLYKNNLSLRFRKRIFSDGLITYGLQLKSEMLENNSSRMEVEETELDFYKIKTDTGLVSLIKTIDVLFFQVENKEIDINSKELKNAILLIESWIKFKVEGTIIPFQKIINLKLKGIDATKIKTLTPIIFGSDKRIRSSVYINPEKTNDVFATIPANSRNLANSSDFFNLNKNYIWVLETSLDSATFFPLYKTNLSSINILEFEVENKYLPKEMGITIMNYFETSLRKEIKLEIQSDSKYRQCIKKINLN